MSSLVEYVIYSIGTFEFLLYNLQLKFSKYFIFSYAVTKVYNI